MPYEDDIAFQRAILANPADTTLKLVYADWLRDRADPRAEYVRLQVQLHTMVSSESAVDAAGWFIQMGHRLDPKWVAFMTTLAQPFGSYGFQGPHPFAEGLGFRGDVCALESQYRTAADWSDGLLADLAFLTTVDWGVCCYGYDDPPIYGFLCDLPNGREPLTAGAVLGAIKAATSFWPEGVPNTEYCRIHTRFGEQPLFDNEMDGNERIGAHGRLRAHLDEGVIWYVSLRTDAGIDGTAPGDIFDTVCLALGRSPHGNRLVGCLTCQQLQIW